MGEAVDAQPVITQPPARTLMGTHFGAIGLPADGEPFNRALMAFASNATTVGETPAAAVIAHTDRSGARMSLTLRPDGAIQCMTPSFAGMSRVTVLADSFGDHECPYETPVIVEVLDDTGEMVHPLALQPEDVAVWQPSFTPGERVDLNVTAFAERIDVFADEAAYRASGTPMAVQSLIPSGMFAPGGVSEQDWVVAPRALISGTVRSATTLVNGLTGLAFVHAVVDSYAMVVDIVIDPVDVDGPPATGSIVSGQFWLSCRRLTG
jgi:hypothetical protein